MLPLVMAAIADRLQGIGGFSAGVSYPPENHVPASPWIMVRQADEPAQVEKRPGRSLVTAYVDVVALVASSEETPRDQARLDGIPEIILDAFDMSLTGGSAAELVPSLIVPSGAVLNRLWTDATVTRGVIQWGGQFCYAAVTRLDVQYERRPVPR